MDKKLVAVAVGGALAAIGAAPALAQNATVNVFGTFYYQWGWINNGNKSATEPYQSYDHVQNPGSEIGFRGEEKLGGGLSVWFQCTSSIDYRGSGNNSSSNSQAGSNWCTRNSALGLRGAFGNAFYGNWQTPWTRINSAANVGSDDTGIWGNAHIIAGTSTTTGISSPSGGTGGNVGQNATRFGGQINSLQQGVFRRRQNNLFTYETPNFAGFQAMAAVTSRNYASAATGAQARARLWSLGAQYANGPVFVGAAYEKHANFYSNGAPAVPAVLTTNAAGAVVVTTPAAAAVTQTFIGSEHAWTIGGSYTVPVGGGLKLGGHYNHIRANVDAGSNVTIKTWHVGMDWRIAGPHGMRAAYSRANQPSGLPGAAMPTRPAVNLAGGTSAELWQLRYVYSLSKRTEVSGGISWTNNRANAGYETGGSSTTQTGGADSHAYGVAIRHTF